VARSDARFEWVFLRLRLVEGIDPADYAAIWEEPFADRYGPLVERLVGEGLLEREGERVRLASGARFVSDAVFTEFALEDAEG
jgi:oxygen-independent coproporphyrinogen-3 oxidase